MLSSFLTLVGFLIAAYIISLGAIAVWFNFVPITIASSFKVNDPHFLIYCEKDEKTGFYNFCDKVKSFIVDSDMLKNEVTLIIYVFFR